MLLKQWEFGALKFPAQPNDALIHAILDILNMADIILCEALS